MTENEEHQLAYRIKQKLNESIEELDEDALVRLKNSRQASLLRQRNAGAMLSLAGLSHNITIGAYPLRIVVMAMALSLGMIGTYYWDQFDQAAEIEEIDSALLADELPPEIYTDSGFHRWLERSSQSLSD